MFSNICISCLMFIDGVQRQCFFESGKVFTSYFNRYPYIYNKNSNFVYFVYLYTLIEYWLSVFSLGH